MQKLKIFLQMKLTYYLLFICLFTAACKEKKEEKKGKDTSGGPVIVDVLIASPQVTSNTIEASGSVIASETTELRSEINGRLVYLNIPEGLRVQKGTIIARINDADLQAQLGKLNVQLDLANTTEQRYKKLLAIGGLNQADYDIAINQINSLKADINILNTQMAKTIIKAPFSGVVGLRKASPGAYVTPADVLATFHNVDKLKVDFTLPEEYANTIKKGSTVTVEIAGVNKQQTRAIILATEPQANTSTRSLLVRALLQNNNATPGSFVKVYINDGNDKKSVLVPSSAIIPEDKDKILVVVKEGKANYVKVETGNRLAGNVEIIKGIAAGDSIVVSGVLFARPNTPVKVRAVKTLESLTQ